MTVRRFNNMIVHGWSLALVASALLSASSALAEPPYAAREERSPLIAPSARARSSTSMSGGIPPSLRAALERFGGARALRVAQGVRAAGSRVALRPMFWITRDRSGAVFALGGLF